MNLPVLKNNFLDWMPHKPPMLWIDEVTGYNEASKTGTCRVNLDKNQHYCESTGFVRPSAFIEFSAQAYGLSAFYFANQSSTGQKLTRALLVGVKDAKIYVDYETLHVDKLGKYIEIHVTEKRHLGPITLVSAEIVSSTGSKVHSCELRVFTHLEG